MKKLLLIGLFGLCSAANAAVFEVEMTGPGGHSNGNYGNVNAVHAGARAILALDLGAINGFIHDGFKIRSALSFLAVSRPLKTLTVKLHQKTRN